MARCRDQHIVEDGRQRAEEAMAPQIHAEVEADYAERLASANWYHRLMLRWEISREIHRRFERVAPPWGLYLSE
jgi:hypothetical protein